MLKLIQSSFEWIHVNFYALIQTVKQFMEKNNADSFHFAFFFIVERRIFERCKLEGFPLVGREGR